MTRARQPTSTFPLHATATGLPGWGWNIFILGQRARICSANQAPRRIVAVAQQNGARRNLADKLQQILPVRVRRQIEVLHIAMLGDRPALGLNTNVSPVLAAFNRPAGESGSA